MILYCDILTENQIGFYSLGKMKMIGSSYMDDFNKALNHNRILLNAGLKFGKSLLNYFGLEDKELQVVYSLESIKVHGKNAKGTIIAWDDERPIPWKEMPESKYNKIIIYIDSSVDTRDEILEIVLHEILHLIHSTLSEEEIIEKRNEKFWLK
jgi:hypothetical protein